jgi:hypothetical protein
MSISTEFHLTHLKPPGNPPGQLSMPMDKGRAATPVVALLEPGGPEAKNDAAAAAVADTANMSIKYQGI